MNTQPRYQLSKHYSTNKDCKPKPRHVHKLSDSNIEDSLLTYKNTDRNFQKSPNNFKSGANNHLKAQSLRPSLYEKN